MALSSKLVPTVQRLINKYGTNIVLSTLVDGGYDPTTSQNIRTQTDQNLIALIEEYADSIRFLGAKTEAGTLIQEGDKKVTISATDVNQVAPQPNNSKLTLQNIPYNIIGVAAQYVDNLVAYYVLHLRKA